MTTTNLIYFTLTSRSILDKAKIDIHLDHSETLQKIVDVANNHHITVVVVGGFGVAACVEASKFEEFFGFIPDKKQSYHQPIRLPLDIDNVADRIEVAGEIDYCL